MPLRNPLLSYVTSVKKCECVDFSSINPRHQQTPGIYSLSPYPLQTLPPLAAFSGFVSTSSGRPKCRVVSSEDCQIRRVTHGSPVHEQFRRRGVAQTGPLNRLPFEVLCRSATCAQDNCQRTEIPPIRVTGAVYRPTVCAHSMLRQPLKVSILPLLLSVFDASTGIDERVRDASEAPRAVTDVGDGRQSRTNPDEVRTSATTRRRT